MACASALPASTEAVAAMLGCSAHKGKMSKVELVWLNFPGRRSLSLVLMNSCEA
jgi:hypothetical protein